MHWQYTPYILPLLTAAAISAALALYAWRRRSVPGARPFAVGMLGVAEWSLGYALRLSSVDLGTKLFWTKVRYLGIVVVPAAWLIFALQYAHRQKWLTRRNVALLAIEPLVTLLLAWTNEFHHLIWVDVGLEAHDSLWVWSVTHGVAFWVHAAYSYLLIFLGSLLLIQAIFRSSRLYRGQAGVLLIGALAPLVGNVLSTFGLISFPLDLTPFGFALAGLAAVWGIFCFRLLDIVPVARRAIVDSMSDGVIVLDAQNRIVDLNLAAERIIGRSLSEAIGQPVTQGFSGWPDLVERHHDIKEAHEEIVLGEGEMQRCYDLRISPLNDHRGNLIGRVLVLHDIVARKQAEASLRDQKQLFENLVAVARATAEQPSLEATLQNALDVAASLTGAECGSLFLLDETGVVTHSILALGKTQPAGQQDMVNRVMGRGLAGWVVRHRQPGLVYDASDDDRWLPSQDGTFIARSALAVPIVSGPALLGLLTLTHSAPGHFSIEHVHLLQAAAGQMALAVRNAQIFDDQRRMTDRQTILFQVLSAVGGYLDPQTSARAAVEAVARLTGWPAVVVFLPDDTMTHLVVQAAAGALSVAEGWRIPVERGITGRAFRTAQTQHAPDASADPDYVSGHPALCSELAVPLRRGERVLGVLDVESDQPAAFDADDVLLAESLAEAIALALDNAQFYEKAQQQATELSALFIITRMTSRSLVLEDTLFRALSATLLSLGFEAGLIGVVDPDDGRLRLMAEHGLPSILAQRLRHSGMEDTLCAYVHDRREGLMISGFEGETPAAVSKMMAETAALGLRACACVPLLHKDQSLGTMALFAHQPRAFSPKEKILLDTIGHQIATAVANARLFQAVAGERSRLQALIESSRDGIALVGLGGMEQRVLLTNAAALELLRLPGQPEDWIGRPILDALLGLRHHAPALVRKALAEMRRLQKGDEPPGEGEGEVPPRTIHWLSLPVLAGTTPLGRLLVLRDMTEERLLEEMRDDLIRTLVHDLRNPLTSISMSLQILDVPHADNLLPNQREMIEIALSGAERMLDLVRNILDVSRLEAGRIPLERTPVLLANLVARILRRQSPLATQRGLRLESDVPPTFPPVWADAQLIDRVLENLIGNGINFTPTGGLVRVSAEAVKNGQDTGVSEVRISVSDNGPGIPPELQSRLFQKFVTGREHESGSGLGLAFCKLAVEAHGGRIWVESEPGQGTTFTFTLPIAQESQIARPG